MGNFSETEDFIDYGRIFLNNLSSAYKKFDNKEELTDDEIDTLEKVYTTKSF